MSGRDITQETRRLFAIDLFGLAELELRTQEPAMYQWVRDRVKGERDQNARAALRDRWWIFGEARSTFRPVLQASSRVITTSLTAKHRIFTFVPAQTICDSATVMLALPDALHLGVLSSSVHSRWALASNSTLEDRPRYIKTVCFENFSFPAEDTGLSPALYDQIATLAEQIDAHRKRQQATHPSLTLTGMYNVLELLRQAQDDRVLSARERTIHAQGLVSVLKELHDELDTAAMQSYGLAADPGKDALLTYLVALNAQRAQEE